MSRPRLWVLITAVVMLVAGALLFGRALLRERSIVASTAAPTPFAAPTPVEVEPDATMCATQVLLGPRTEVAELVLMRPAPGLEARASGPGYASPPAPLGDGRGTGGAALARIEPPEREMLGRLCVTNTGRAPAAFVGTTEFRTQTRLQTTLDDEPVEADVALTFYEDRSTSLLGYVPDLMGHMTTFRGFLGVTFLMWLLLGAVTVGVPVTVLWVLLRGLEEDEA